MTMAIGAESPDQVSIFVIITIPEGRPESMTANMLGPVVVNPEIDSKTPPAGCSKVPASHPALVPDVDVNLSGTDG